MSLPVLGDQKIKLARRLIRVRQYDNAARLLEEVYENNPDNQVVQNLLRSCYDALGQYSKAELLAHKFIEREPDNVGHRLYLAGLLAKMGRSDESKAAFEKAESLLDPNNLIDQTNLIHSMIACGQDDLALERIDRVRATSGQPLLFGLERGTLLEGKRQYKAATEEYLTVLNEDTTHLAAQAERKLMALLEFSGSSAEVEQVLMNQSDATAEGRTLNLLADFYIKSGHLDKAFNYALKEDSLDGFSGRPLRNYLLQCRDRKTWGQVAKMADYILRKYPDSSFVTDVSSFQAEALARLGKGPEAIAAYERVFEGAEHPRRKGDALFGIGEVYFETLHDYSKAREYFDSVVTRYPRGFAFLNARKSIPLCYLREGRLVQARKEFAALSGVRQLEDIQEETAYYLALTALFARMYDTAEVGFRKLIVDYPRGYYVNDALELVLQIDGAGGDKVLLDDFAEALFFQEQGNLDSTRARLNRVADAANKALADVALYRLAGLDLKEQDSTSAMATIDRLIADFPDSYYFPYGMKIKADMLIAGNPAAEEARQLYRRLLESFPDYPFASEVREKLRKLETEGLIG